MRIAVFSDVHGNALALDAVLADARAAGAEEFWVVGDLVSDGPRPADVIARLKGLRQIRTVRGNTDRYVLTGDLPDVVLAGGADLIRTAQDSRAWTRAAIPDIGWLAVAPVESRLTLPDGTRVLLVHAAPGTDDGPGIHAALTDQDLVDAGVTTAGADLIFVGHTHVPLERTVGGVRVVNLGSVSLPATVERRAMWTLLTATAEGHRIERKFSPYDIAAVCAELDAEKHPSADWLRAKFHRAA
jgi:putative phosphoesterase